ncbi:MAG: hypothetical protein K1X85_05615 [Ignavibacteria bacterium]|nr:hypothetical protein [Ignavibacteria bacterium]
MYLQEIVISPNIFEKIGRAYSPDSDEDLDFKSYKKNLAMKKIVFEKDADEGSLIWSAIKEMMEKFDYLGKQKMNSVLKPFLLSNRVEYKTIDKAETFSKNKILNTILNLALITESKIINAEDKSPKELSEKHSALSELEILNIEEFIDPPSLSRFCSLNRTIKIEQGKEFRFQKILKGYLSDCTELEVNDKYLRSENGTNNLVRLLSLCTDLRRVKIYTILRNGNPRDNFFYTSREFESHLKMRFPGTAVILQKTNSKIGKDRYISDGNFKMTFSPGLDFVNENYLAEKNPILIRIERISNLPISV